jgi:phenylalanine-4-hydroxylase
MPNAPLIEPSEPASSGPLQLRPAAQSTAPVQRVQKLHLLLGQMATRSFGNEVASAAVLPLRTDAQTWHELLAIQQAVWQRLQAQQTDWLQGCSQLAREYSQLRQANTVSKFMEQEYNVAAQFGALLSNQATALIGLLENIQVDYSYWISQKLTPPEAD